MKLEALKFIFKPKFWVMNEFENKALTDFINNSLDQGHKPKIIDEYECELNGKIVWIANYPYGFGTIEREFKGRPDRLTVERLYKEVQKQILE